MIDMPALPPYARALDMRIVDELDGAPVIAMPFADRVQDQGSLDHTVLIGDGGARCVRCDDASGRQWAATAEALHELRDDLVPINKRYPLKDLMTACRDYLRVKNRRISFEWAMIDGINDQPRDARELAQLCGQLTPSAHVNLIPLNPTPGWPTKGTSAAGVRAFAQQLEDLGVNVTVRRNRGTDIDAACGQLAAGQPVKLTNRRGIV